MSQHSKLLHAGLRRNCSVMCSEADDRPSELFVTAIICCPTSDLTSPAKSTSLPKVIWKRAASRRCNTRPPKSPHWLQWRAPNSPPKVPLSVDRSPNPTTCLIPGPFRPMMPNGIRIRSAVFPQCTGQTDRPTHVRTDLDRQNVHGKV